MYSWLLLTLFPVCSEDWGVGLDEDKLELELCVGDRSWALSRSRSRPGLKDSRSCSTRSSVGPQRWYPASFWSQTIIVALTERMATSDLEEMEDLEKAKSCSITTVIVGIWITNYSGGSNSDEFIQKRNVSKFGFWMVWYSNGPFENRAFKMAAQS